MTRREKPWLRAALPAQCLTMAAWIVFFSFSAGHRAHAQEYPAKPVRFILAFTAGGALDIIGRVITRKMSENLRVQMAVDNRPGAGGIIGTEAAAKASPDGYTIFLCNVTNAIYPGLYQKPVYDALRDFVAISPGASFSFILAVNPSMPVQSVAQLVALAKKRPDDIVYGSSGIGSPPHLAGELMKNMTGMRMTHVPFAGNPQAQQSLVGGDIQVLFINTANAMPLIDAKRVRGLAVSSLQRSQVAPGFPTVAESGLPGFDISSWGAFCGPARTPEAIVNKLNSEVTKALEAPDVKSRLLQQGFEVTPMPPARFQAYYKAEIEKYKKIIRDANIEMQ